jgi:hypothetical protein
LRNLPIEEAVSKGSKVSLLAPPTNPFQSSQSRLLQRNHVGQPLVFRLLRHQVAAENHTELGAVGLTQRSR